MYIRHRNGALKLLSIFHFIKQNIYIYLFIYLFIYTHRGEYDGYITTSPQWVRISFCNCVMLRGCSTLPCFPMSAFALHVRDLVAFDPRFVVFLVSCAPVYCCSLWASSAHRVHTHTHTHTHKPNCGFCYSGIMPQRCWIIGLQRLNGAYCCYCQESRSFK